MKSLLHTYTIKNGLCTFGSLFSRFTSSTFPWQDYNLWWVESRESCPLLKADRPHWRDYQQTPTDYRHTDNHFRLVLVVVALCCTRQSRAPNPRVKRESTDKQIHTRTNRRMDIKKNQVRIKTDPSAQKWPTLKKLQQKQFYDNVFLQGPDSLYHTEKTRTFWLLK